MTCRRPLSTCEGVVGVIVQASTPARVGEFDNRTNRRQRGRSIVFELHIVRLEGVREWGLVGIPFVQGKASMAGKDKGGRASKKPAAKSAKEKRQAKRDKKAAHSHSGLVP